MPTAVPLTGAVDPGEAEAEGVDIEPIPPDPIPGIPGIPGVVLTSGAKVTDGGAWPTDSSVLSEQPVTSSSALSVSTAAGNAGLAR